MLGTLRKPLRQLAERMPKVGERLHAMKQGLERRWAAAPSEASRAARYRRDAEMRAREYTGYRHAPACAACDLQPVCDGFYGDYTALFGDAEAAPIALGGRVDDPQHFSRAQLKRVHPMDVAWLEREAERT
jgi:hypothetical protein